MVVEALEDLTLIPEFIPMLYNNVRVQVVYLSGQTRPMDTCSLCYEMGHRSDDYLALDRCRGRVQWLCYSQYYNNELVRKQNEERERNRRREEGSEADIDLTSGLDADERMMSPRELAMKREWVLAREQHELEMGRMLEQIRILKEELKKKTDQGRSEPEGGVEGASEAMDEDPVDVIEQLKLMTENNGRHEQEVRDLKIERSEWEKRRREDLKRMEDDCERRIENERAKMEAERIKAY